MTSLAICFVYIVWQIMSFEWLAFECCVPTLDGCSDTCAVPDRRALPTIDWYQLSVIVARTAFISSFFAVGASHSRPPAFIVSGEMVNSGAASSSNSFGSVLGEVLLHICVEHVCSLENWSLRRTVPLECRNPEAVRERNCGWRRLPNKKKTRNGNVSAVFAKCFLSLRLRHSHWCVICTHEQFQSCRRTEAKHLSHRTQFSSTEN